MMGRGFQRCPGRKFRPQRRRFRRPHRKRRPQARKEESLCRRCRLKSRPAYRVPLVSHAPVPLVSHAPVRPVNHVLVRPVKSRIAVAVGPTFRPSGDANRRRYQNGAAASRASPATSQPAGAEIQTASARPRVKTAPVGVRKITEDPASKIIVLRTGGSSTPRQWGRMALYWCRTDGFMRRWTSL